MEKQRLTLENVQEIGLDLLKLAKNNNLWYRNRNY